MKDRKTRRYPILMSVAILAGLGLILAAAGFLWMTFMPGNFLSLAASRFGVLPVEGVITESKDIVCDLIRFKKDDAIKAVILRINSPGGAVGPTQEICTEIKKLAALKPVVASLGAVAASGGYYIAAPARVIVANPGTITGSIGVLMQFMRVEDLLNKIGIQMEVLKAGEYKDMGSPHRKLTEKERQLIQDLMNDVRGQFVAEVVRGRNMPAQKVNEIADGRIFSGERAKELGLVDILGSLEDAVNSAKELTGLKGEVDLVYPEKKGLGIFDLLGAKMLQQVARLLSSHTFPKISYLWTGLPGSILSENY